MIVQDSETQLLLITQPDHALAARRVMEHWPALAGHPRRDDILLAIEEHDVMWAATDAAPSVDPTSGAIVDFIHVPLDVKHEWRAVGAARVKQRPWAGALIAHHRVFVYSRFRSDPAWRAFFPEAEAGRDALRDAAGHSGDTLAEDYMFLRLGDLISLAFCTGWSQPERFGAWTVQRVGDEVHVSPGRTGAHVPLAVPARRLEKRRFASDADLRRSLAAADVIQLQGHVRW